MRVENLCPKDLEFGDPAVLVLHIPLEGEEGDNNVCLNKGKKKKNEYAGQVKTGDKCFTEKHQSF